MKHPNSEPVARPVEIRMFGSFALQVHGRPVSIERSKVRWLLARLVLHGEEGLDREWLAEQFWPDSTMKTARDNLRTHLKWLRRALGEEHERLSSSRHMVSLDLTEVWVDVHVFDAAVRAGSLAKLGVAIELYRGPLLETCLEEWAIALRGHYEASALKALQDLANHAREVGNAQDAAQLLHKAIDIDHLQDRLQLALVDTLMSLGDTTAAQKAYTDFRRRYHQDFGEEIGSELRREFNRSLSRTMSRDPTSSEAACSLLSLSRSGSALIGRTEELARLERLLTSVRLVTLTGIGGIGKTRLAVEAAARFAKATGQTIVFVDVASCVVGEEALAQAAASALNLPTERSIPVETTLIQYLRDQKALLLLDNCEPQLAACASFVRLLLRTCPRLRILATSRKPLDIDEEELLPVPPLSGPDAMGAITIETAFGTEAVQMFLDAGERAMPGLRLTEDNLGAVVALCRSLDGIPLALELAGAWAGVMTPQAMLKHLSSHGTLLVRRRREHNPRQDSLQAVLEASYQMLEPPLRRFFFRLSIFRDGWTADAAHAVCEEHDCVPMLALLRDRALVISYEVAQNMRFRMLEPLRESAYAQLPAADLDSLSQRHASYFAGLADESVPHFTGPEQQQWLERLNAELGNFRLALEWCRNDMKHGASYGLKLVGALWTFWVTRGYINEAHTYLQNMLAHAGQISAERDHAKALLGAGVMLHRQGEYAGALRLLRRSLHLYNKINNKAGVANVLHQIGQTQQRRQRYRRARVCYELSLAIERGLERIDGIASELYSLGRLAWAEHEPALAYERLEEALELFQRYQDARGIAAVLNQLGMMSEEQGDIEAAQEYYGKSLSQYDGLSDLVGKVCVLHNLGSVAFRNAEYESARTYFQQSLIIENETSHTAGIAESLDALSVLARYEGDLKRAAILFGAGETLMASIGAHMQSMDPHHEEALIAALGNQAFETHKRKGQRMRTAEIVNYTLKV